MAIPEYKITMLGPSGVGKTSLLTAMYEKFEDTAGKLQMTIKPASETQKQIQECLSNLKSLTRRSNNIKIQPGEGIRGSITSFSFYFDLCISGRPSSLRLHFRDYPGGWINSNPEKRDRVIDFVKESVAVLIPIDATAIMEKDAQYHEFINLPDTITNVIKEAYTDLDSPRLVILAPIKCEKYVRGEGEQQREKVKKLLEYIELEYKNLIQFLKAENLFSKIAVVKVPVQTVGNVILSTIDEEEEYPIFYFRKTTINAKYEPKDSEQPIKYLLQFILKLHQERGNPLVKRIRKWLQLDKPFQEAANKFARETNSPNSEIVQGHNWLDI